MKSKKNFPLFKILDISYFRIIHSIKTAIACLIGLALERYYQWPMGQWIPITTMVVMSAQTHFGGALSKAYMRFLGTVCGVAFVITVLWFLGDNIIVVFCTVFLASIIFTYIASSHGDISYAGTLGGVTVILILTGQNVGIQTAIQRGFYIVIGIIIALMVSRFVFPIHARNRLRYHVAKTLRNLSKLYSIAIHLEEKPDEDFNAELSSKVADDIADQPRLIHEAVVGSLAFATKKTAFSDILNSERSLSHLINLMYLSLHEVLTPIEAKRQWIIVEDLHTTIEDGLIYLANCFETMEPPRTMVNLEESLVKIAHVVEKLPKSESAFQLIAEYSFLFFMEQILKELENMRKLIVKVNSKSTDSMI